MPFLMCEVMKRNDIFDKTDEISTTRNTKMYVNTLSSLIEASKYFDDVSEPEYFGSGGSSKESHNFSSAVSRL